MSGEGSAGADVVTGRGQSDAGAAQTAGAAPEGSTRVESRADADRAPAK